MSIVNPPHVWRINRKSEIPLEVFYLILPRQVEGVFAGYRRTKWWVLPEIGELLAFFYV
jgi:hypothetical protein